MLHGRDAECALIHELLGQARAGSGSAAVLRGDAGIGKTALLDYAQSRAAGLTVLRATGLEAESELAFAALHQLLRPVMQVLDGLPDPQARALRAALGLTPATGHDRFLVSSAVLSLLGEAAGNGGLVGLVDDAQWVDTASLEALLFAARRLGTDGVAMLFAVRPGGERRLAAPELRLVDLAGLTREAAGALVEERAGELNPSVGARLAELTGGNPLALAELATALNADQLAGRAPLPDPLPMTEGLERAFLEQVRQLPRDQQAALLVLAMDSTGSLAVVTAALDELGIPVAALDELEAARLIQLDLHGDRVRHPLIRSAVVAGAGFGQRRRVHQALADVLAKAGEQDRSAWHRAAATAGTDDVVADELEAAAVRALERSAHAAAASGYARAAELTFEPERKARRYLRAAGASWLAAKPDVAQHALVQAGALTTDPLNRADIARLQGIIEWRRGVATEAYRILREGAELVAERAPERALEMLIHATEASGYIGDVEALVAACRRAETIDPGGSPTAERSREYLLAFPAMLSGDTERGSRILRRLLEDARGTADPTRLIWDSIAAFYVGDITGAAQLLGRATQLARVADMTGSLPYVLELYAAAERAQGRLASAEALATEGLGLARETQQDSSAAVHLATLAGIAAIRGRAEECQTAADAALALAVPRRLGLAAGLASYALALSSLLQGRYPQALQQFNALALAGPGATHPLITWYSLPDRVEAAVRAGDQAVAGEALAQLDQWVTVSTGATTRATLLRCRALLAPTVDAEALYREALAVHPAGELPIERARTQLLYGEWLRRERRRVEARDQLRQAQDDFHRHGAEALAERARTELRATGESTRRRDPTALAQLTPQELQIARLVAQGASNGEVAARLFLSRRTVEYHLYKIYPKLGVGTRTELAHLLATDASLAG